MTDSNEKKNQLALFGGDKAVRADQEDILTWPIITEQHEEAVLEVLRDGQMSGLEITKEFEMVTIHRFAGSPSGNGNWRSADANDVPSPTLNLPKGLRLRQNSAASSNRADVSRGVDG